jgi:hypothetical protein
MNFRKISLLFLAVVGISLVMVSIIPMKVFAGALPTGKEQGYPGDPTKKPKKTKTPTKVPPSSTFTATKIPTSTNTSTATKIPTATKTFTATKVPSLIPSSTPTIIVPIAPPPTNPSPCCGSGAIILAGYAFFAVKNSRSKKTEI